MQSWYTDIPILCTCCKSCTTNLNKALTNAKILDKSHDSCFFRAYYTLNVSKDSITQNVKSLFKVPCETKKCNIKEERQNKLDLSVKIDSYKTFNERGYKPVNTYSNLDLVNHFLARAHSKKLLLEPIYMQIELFCNIQAMTEYNLNNVLKHIKNQLEDRELLLKTNSDWKVELLVNDTENSVLNVYFEELESGTKNITEINANNVDLSVIKNLILKGVLFF